MLESEALKLRRGQRVYLLGRRNRDGSPVVARVNGRVQGTSGQWRVPLKRGLYQYGYITPANVARFSLRAQPWGVRHNPCGKRTYDY